MTTLHSKNSLPNKSPYALWSLLIAFIGLGYAGFELYQGISVHNARPAMSWLLGFSVWFSAAIGMLFLVMIWHVFGSTWSVIVRRQLEHALGVFPYLGLIFLPLLILAWYSDVPGLIWHWMDPSYILPGGETVQEDVLFQSKSAYLDKSFFTWRVIGYFLFWSLITCWLRRCSFRQDQDPQLIWTNRAHAISAAGIPLCAIVTTFAAFDFYMSLSYHWFSTMYGVWFFATSMRAALALTVIICYGLASKGYLKGLYNQAHRYDLGSLCFAFTVFWAYISFCQYFLIYNANIPEETFWYNIRELNANWEKNSWWFLSLWGLFVGYFVVPFIYLLFYKNKITPQRLLFIACWILTFHLFDLYYNLLPMQTAAENAVGYVVNEFDITLSDIAAILGVGGVFFWAFFSSMPKTAPIPICDPRIEGSIHHHE